MRLHAWSEKKVELWQRWRKFWENPAITKDLICRKACKKNFPCKYTKAPNISKSHQTTFGMYVCHKSYQRYKPDQARSFASTQQTPKWPKDSKKGSPEHLLARNSACLPCNSYLSRHDLPVFDSTNNIQQHPPRCCPSHENHPSWWCQESLSAESEVDLSGGYKLHANLKLPITQMRTERSEQKFNKNRSENFSNIKRSWKISSWT